jgi:cysteine desulfurase
LDKNIIHLKAIETQFKQKLKNNIKNIIFNGSQSQKLPGLISVSFPGFNSSILLIKLDREKICVSNGSACGAGDIKPSPILSAIGLNELTNLSTLRFSFGTSNNSEEIKTLIDILNNIIIS